MRNTMKVARWEIKRNLKNKTFIISLFLTPALMVVFGILGSLSGGGAEDEKQAMKIYVNDGLGVFESLEETADRYHLPLRLFRTDVKEADVGKELAKREKAAFLFADERAFSEGVLPLYTGDDFPDAAISQIQMLTEPVKFLQLQRLGLTDEQLAVVTKPISVQPMRADEGAQSPERNKDGGEAAAMKKAVPGIFAGVILLCIIFSGMMIFQSASQEKKDKIAEILLSSVTPNELMQGKIVGYFVLGLIQVAVFIAFGIPFVLWKTDFPLFRYLFVPELLLFLLIAVLGYLLFAALFVGIGATMSDISTAGNFQGLVIMLPFIPLFFIGPVSADPSGTLAQVLTYVPFTSPVILLLRLVLLDEWRWLEIVLSLAVLAASVWLFMKLAGKIFKTGILLYGKNATPKEIWKWIRA